MKNNYSDLLKDPRWQKRKTEILTRDNFSCQLCKDTTSSLQVHHKQYIKGRTPWEYEDDQLITLCEFCHTEVEFLKKNNSPISEISSIIRFKKIDSEMGSRIIITALADRINISIYENSIWERSFYLADTALTQLALLLKPYIKIE